MMPRGKASASARCHAISHAGIPACVTVDIWLTFRVAGSMRPVTPGERPMSV